MDEIEVNEIIKKVNLAEEEIGKAIIGQKDIVRQVILAILSDGHVLLESVPGLGKTQLVKTISKVFQLNFSRIQFTPDLMPADVTGTNLLATENGKHTFQFQKGPLFTNLLLADEINRATPKTQSALLEAMQESTITVGRETYSLSAPFMVLATQNPIENEGTYPLPEAQLDRFLFKLYMKFPALDELKEIVDITVTNKAVDLASIITGDEILIMRTIINDMPIADAVMEYALKLVVATHPDHEDAADITKQYVLFGASPRAAQAIIKTAKARALLNGRFNVAFEDIDFVAYPALRHRIITNFEALSDGITTDHIIKQMIEGLKVV